MPAGRIKCEELDPRRDIAIIVGQDFHFGPHRLSKRPGALAYRLGLRNSYGTQNGKHAQRPGSHLA
ncbi:MAG: hypothetical protein ACLP9L_06660 [Thermoguttaceae bacterium]